MSNREQYNFRIKYKLLLAYHKLAESLDKKLAAVIKDLLADWYYKHTN